MNPASRTKPRPPQLSVPWRPLELRLPWAAAGQTALDRFYRRPLGIYRSLLVQTDLGALAGDPGLPDGENSTEPEYPGLEEADLLCRDPAPGGEQRVWLFRCGEDLTPAAPSPFPAWNLVYRPDRDAFSDPDGTIYPLLRRKELVRTGPILSWRDTAAGALLAARYGFEPARQPAEGLPTWDLAPPAGSPELEPAEQRILLVSLLEGPHPRTGLEILRRSGFLSVHWPELAALEEIKQSKWDHPEGDVLQHTLAALAYQKKRDLTVALALLLHDLGKAQARREGENRFHQHAQLGVSPASRFLRRLNLAALAPGLPEDVLFLVRHHMLPAYIAKLPFSRTAGVLASPLAPRLLEVYRCDLSSTFRDPAGYYEAGRTYRRLCREQTNPYRRQAPPQVRPP